MVDTAWHVSGQGHADGHHRPRRGAAITTAHYRPRVGFIIATPDRRSIHLDCVRGNPCAGRDRGIAGSIGDAYAHALAKTTMSLVQDRGVRVCQPVPHRGTETLDSSSTRSWNGPAGTTTAARAACRTTCHLSSTTAPITLHNRCPSRRRLNHHPGINTGRPLMCATTSLPPQTLAACRRT